MASSPLILAVKFILKKFGSILHIAKSEVSLLVWKCDCSWKSVANLSSSTCTRDGCCQVVRCPWMEELWFCTEYSVRTIRRKISLGLSCQFVKALLRASKRSCCYHLKTKAALSALNMSYQIFLTLVFPWDWWKFIPSVPLTKYDVSVLNHT